MSAGPVTLAGPRGPRRTAARVGHYAALAAYVVFLGFPLLWMLTTAFKTPRELASPDLTLLPRSFDPGNFLEALERADLVQAAFNTFRVSLATMLLTVLVTLPAAYGLARFRTRMRTVATGWILVSQVFPYILIVIPLFLILQQFQLNNSLAGLVVVYMVWMMPFSLWMLQGFVAGIPVDLEEAGAVDGAGRLRVLRSIVMPLLFPGVVATAVFTFISSWNEFFFALVLLQDPALSTISLTLARFVGGEGQVQLGALAAGSLLATVPSLVFFALIQRRLTSGLLSGAVKG